MEDELRIQARALGDPTRHRIFRFVADSVEPVGVAELTEHVGLNHNAVRQHLSKLVEADLVLESTAPPQGRGRPKLLYTANPNTDGRWGVSGPYERLAVLLAEVVRSGDDPEEVGHRAGRRLALGTRAAGADPIQEMSDEMARQGFEPMVRRSGDEFTLVLANCPFVAAAMADQDSVCRLHLGLAKGAAETIGGVEVESLRPHDPRTANCLLHCRLEPDEPLQPVVTTTTDPERAPRGDETRASGRQGTGQGAEGPSHPVEHELR